MKIFGSEFYREKIIGFKDKLDVCPVEVSVVVRDGDGVGVGSADRVNDDDDAPGGNAKRGDARGGFDGDGRGLRR